jgi:hypothetical protein
VAGSATAIKHRVGGCATGRAGVDFPGDARPTLGGEVRVLGEAAILPRPMLKVGGEVDSFCTRCQMTLAHTIHAIVDRRPVKVECNTCHGIHRYRSSDAPAAPALRASRPARERPVTVSFEETLRGKNLAMAQRYSPRATYQIDQVIEHPTFGMGWVSAVRDASKIEVTFRADVKVLVHGKG